MAAGSRPFRPGESLTYDLELLGIVRAGTMQLSVERPISAGQVIPLRARAKSTKSVASLEPFVGVAISWIYASTLRPERYREEAEEGGVHKSSDVRLSPPGQNVVIEHVRGNGTDQVSTPREHDALDAISALYYLRAARLSPGDRFCLDLVAAGRVWRVEGSVAARAERVETPAGKFETLRVDAQAKRADRPDQKPRPMHVWIGTDARRLPVAMVSEIELGPVSATLAALH
jgi:hypothetical protein